MTDQHITEANIQRGFMAVDIKSYHGIGAKLEWVLEILTFCDENKLVPQFKFSYQGSDNLENYFNSFFKIRLL